MANLKNFLKMYWPSIMTIVITFLTLITTFKILDINFNSNTNKEVKKIVTVEAFSSKPTIESVQTVNKGNMLAQHDTCSKHKPDTCMINSQCILLDGDRCVGGSCSGLTYHTTNDGKDEIEYKYYKCKGEDGKNKCVGNCPK